MPKDSDSVITSADPAWVRGLSMIFNREGLIGLLLCCLVAFHMYREFTFSSEMNQLFKVIATNMEKAHDLDVKRDERMRGLDERLVRVIEMLGEKQK